jgi:flagellar biosynthesis GTPase FlhF
MASFPTWREWLVLRELNSRKAALLGLGPDLSGSVAELPNTDHVVMDVASKKGVVTSKKKYKKKFMVTTGRMASRLFGHTFTAESHEMKPDYSFDRWVQKAKEFRDDVNKMVHSAEDEEKKIDKEKEKKLKEKEKKSKELDKEIAKLKSQLEKQGPIERDEDNEDNELKKKEKAWKSLVQIHKERPKDFEQPPSGSSGKSSKSTERRSNLSSPSS